MFFLGARKLTVGTGRGIVKGMADITDGGF